MKLYVCIDGFDGLTVNGMHPLLLGQLRMKYPVTVVE